MTRYSAMTRPVLAVTLFLLAPSAYAIDCRKATTVVERMTCADKRLQKADAAMASAYAGLLKATDDAEIRATLVASQKRWLATRDEQLGRLGEDQDPPDAETQRTIVLKAIQARTRNLSRSSDTDPKGPQMIATLQAQRRFAARFTGGAFAGFDTTCDFLPSGDTYDYGCFGRRRYQNEDRVCTVAEDWASGHVSETRTVGRVAEGKLQTVATCSIGAGDDDQACPDPDHPSRPQGRWKREPTTSGGEDVPASHLPGLDADVSVDDDARWLPTCLADPAYPPPDRAVVAPSQP